MAGPPRQCTVAMAPPWERAAATDSATVLGMSCHFRSRKTRTPRAANSFISGGPSLTNNTEPNFAQRNPGSRSARASASRPVARSKATTSSATDEVPGDPFRHAGVRHGRRPDRHQGRAGAEVLPRVGGGADAADTYHRNADTLAHAHSGQHA